MHTFIVHLGQKPTIVLKELPLMLQLASHCNKTLNKETLANYLYFIY